MELAHVTSQAVSLHDWDPLAAHLPDTHRRHHSLKIVSTVDDVRLACLHTVAQPR